jgi:hypothetical protein
MKSRNLAIAIIAILAVLGIVAGSAQTSKPTTTGAPGRFQLFQGDHYVAISGASAPTRLTEVFRIDTQTGETRMFVGGVDPNGTVRNFWQKIDESR